MTISTRLFALIMVAASAGQAQETTPRQRAKEQLAVRAAAGRVLDALRAASSTQSVDRTLITEELARAMLADVAAHRKAGESRESARGLVRERRLAALGAELTNAVRSAQEQSPLPIRADAVMQAVGGEWNTIAAAGADRFLAAQFDPVFADARARAVAAQQREAEREAIRPAPAAVDERWSGWVSEDGTPAADAEAKLAAWLAGAMRHSPRPLFEEVERGQADAHRRAAAEVARQYARQREALLQARPPAEARTAKQLEEALRVAAEAVVAEERRDAAAADRAEPAYGVFTATGRELVRAALRLEQERLAEFVVARRDYGVTEEGLARDIERDPAAHREPKASAGRLTEAAAAGCAGRLAAEYGAAPLAAHFTALLGGGGAAAQRFREAVRAQVEAALPAARARVAERQLAPLAAGLRPDRAASDAAAARWLDAGGRDVKTTEEALARLKDEGLEVAAQPWLHEAATQLVACVALRVRAACDALNGQLQALRDLEKEKAESLRADVAANRPVEQIIRGWRQDLSDRWGRTAGAASPYPRLLARTEDQLNKTVRQLYDARKQELAKAAAPTPASESEKTEPVPPQTAAVERGTQPPEVDRDENKPSRGGMSDDVLLSSADIVINLGDRSAREGRGRLSEGDEDRTSFDYDPAAAQAAADAIFAAVSGPLTQVMDARAEAWGKTSGGFRLFRRADPPELKIYVVIGGNEIRHRTSLLLRKQVKELVADWSARHRKGLEPVALRWTVGLGAGDVE